MARLCKELGLSDNILLALFQNKIFTVLDFLQEGAERLSTICNIGFKEILEVRQNLVTNLSALPVSGAVAYESLLASSALIQSGIPSLDTLLCGGLMTGSVLELCGLSSDGKTQLCLTITANVTAVHKQAVYYVDTTDDFSAHHVLGIMKQKDVEEQECQEALEKIHVIKVKNIYELIQFLHSMKKSLGEDESSLPRLVIVDSITTLYFPFMGSETNQGLGLLNHVKATMKVLATEFHMLFIVVNLATQFVEGEGAEMEGEVEEGRPMLGRYWLHAPSTRLLISRVGEGAQRTIRVVKSTHLPLGLTCSVTVTSQGVV